MRSRTRAATIRTSRRTSKCSSGTSASPPNRRLEPPRAIRRTGTAASCDDDTTAAPRPSAERASALRAQSPRPPGHRPGLRGALHRRFGSPTRGWRKAQGAHRVPRITRITKPRNRVMRLRENTEAAHIKQSSELTVAAVAVRIVDMTEAFVGEARRAGVASLVPVPRSPIAFTARPDFVSATRGTKEVATDPISDKALALTGRAIAVLGVHRLTITELPTGLGIPLSREL
jgi:hypothetical protein